jgi:nondiscriminating glutamyl-tRNA synthetase
VPSAPVRVRFAPSPTGYLHVGGARTAIFNWLYARHNRGSFILRIEDTDVERSTEESEVSLLGDLHGLGLDWDEGPDVSGTHGPYRQSERLDLYRRHADSLVDAGRAYPCFCADEVLEAKRQEAVARGASPRYDGKCRGLSRAEVSEMRAEGTPEVVRFIVPPGVVRFHDLIRGEVEMDTEMVGDFVLLRSNGHPTYNYAAAIDDHAMEISHVLRGEEHLPNTLRQILIYTAFDFPLPEFGHLPLILAADRSKLSKRHGGASVGELRDLGFLPEAVFNYLVLLGWSHPEEKEVLSREELVAAFSLDRVSKSPSVYDRDKLRWMSGQYIRKTPVEVLLEEADPFFPQGIRNLYNKKAREKILSLLHEKIETLADLAEKSAPFEAEPRFEEEAAQVLRTPDALRVMAALEERIRSAEGELTGPGFKSMVEDVGRKTGLKGKALFFPVRAALTGAVHGPDLAGFAELKGRPGVLALLERAGKFAAGSES